MIHALFFILFLYLFVMHEKYRIADEQHTDINDKEFFLKRRWHLFKGFLQALCITYATWNFYVETGHEWKSTGFLLVMLSSYWLIHSTLLNLLVLNKHWNYVGYTDNIDKLLRKYLGKNVEINAAIVRITFLIVSIVILCVSL